MRADRMADDLINRASHVVRRCVLDPPNRVRPRMCGWTGVNWGVVWRVGLSWGRGGSVVAAEKRRTCRVS